MNATKLKEYRVSKGMTQAELATWLGCSKHAVVSWENGRNPVQEWVIARIRAEHPTINPVLTLEQFTKAQAAAAEKGMTLQDWLADLIKQAL